MSLNSDSLSDGKSTYEWVEKFVRGIHPDSGVHKSIELRYISSEQLEDKTIEYWDYVYYYYDSYEIWKTEIWFDSRYSRDSVPYRAVYHLRSDATPRRYLPEN